MKVEVPYNLTADELELEPVEVRGNGRGLESLRWLLDQPNPSDAAGELERVMRGAVVLSAHLESIGEPASFDDCLKTAIIWERG